MPRVSTIFSLLAVLCIPFLGGCGNPDAVPSHTADEQKAVDDVKNLTPEQKIARIKNGPMPESAKAQMIKDIQAGKS